ncbi:MAG: deoxyribose-phosphate aldolase [Rhodospirillales bacterium]|nr:deoxyribose-phosphate aldolase [Rhodospirillales bacterium]
MMPENERQLAALIDQTELGLAVTRSDLEAFVARAVEKRFAAVCILPNMVAFARRITAGTQTRVATVVSFPLGADVAEVKRAEARDALERGADEIDMVIDVASARMGDAAAITREVRLVREVLPEGALLKTIIEMPLLTAEQAVAAARAAEEGGAHFVKTSTGFKPLGIRGTNAEDVRLLRSVLRPETAIKAAGGVSSWPLVAAALAAGATRIGTSSGLAILAQFAAANAAPAAATSRA